MNGWFIVIWLTIMLAVAAVQVTVAVTGWQADSPYVSTHDDPSPGPNVLF